MAENKADDPLKEAEHLIEEAAKALGPGVITGAADDDPSGIATYSQAGAQFGFNMLWTALMCLPLMIAVQLIAGRIGAVTGQGLAANVKKVFPRPVLWGLVGTLLFANIVNISADIAAMGGAGAMLLPGVNPRLLVFGVGALSLLLQVFVPYDRYVGVLKWLTLSLLAYIAVAFTVKIPWGEVALRTVAPQITFGKASATMVVAILGTTISPYLFFWQSSEEVEELEKAHQPPVRRQRARSARKSLRHLATDTTVGMTFSLIIFFVIILTTAATLHTHGITQVNSAADAAKALEPVAGRFASQVFALGILGTGLLAVPVLAGSAAYAVAEVGGWTEGLNRKVMEAPGFYGIIALAVAAGMALSFSPIDPIQALVWAAVVNGVAAPPIMVATMLVVRRKDVMGVFVATRWQTIVGWAATGIMGLAAVAMIVLSVV